MDLKPLHTSTIVALCTVVFAGAVVARENVATLDVSGIIKDAKGAHFATVRGYGLVQAGDIITYRSHKFKIEAITPSGVQYKMLRVAVENSGTALKEPLPTGQPKDYDPRDPFLPLGFK